METKKKMGGLFGAITLGSANLKKTETVEKHNLNFSRKESIQTKPANTSTGGKSDLFAEIQKAANKKK